MNPRTKGIPVNYQGDDVFDDDDVGNDQDEPVMVAEEGKPGQLLDHRLVGAEEGQPAQVRIVQSQHRC